ncbi:hypothetical protein H920_02039 [Fukomys damarensis]|uniref:Uncharacterized protein n=1 Tax=Fukomys damarensis TaxID=885580 RepID=A0A091E1Z9_FUKDA|nr:hypothetical protein H920_02039 [Fukomys damarensis]
MPTPGTPPRSPTASWRCATSLPLPLPGTLNLDRGCDCLLRLRLLLRQQAGDAPGAPRAVPCHPRSALLHRQPPTHKSHLGGGGGGGGSSPVGGRGYPAARPGGVPGAGAEWLFIDDPIEKRKKWQGPKSSLAVYENSCFYHAVYLA